ncbi:uncharacterized protein LOC143213405 isoform X2 [Lasioglossum baleicum]|uniref:uncharacterized protein LOC143213405 isoform X2 n=1 Tax=Lasioglossum baleicum TaxID=434251 RepID=UPI003FCCB301
MEFEEHGKPSEENETCADANDILSRQLSKCRELYNAIDERKRSIHDLESSISLLQVSISSKQIKYNVSAKGEDVVRQKSIEAKETADAMEQELKKLISTRIGHNFWDRLTSNAEYFLSAYMEYSSAKLSEDIEWYRQEFEKIQQELSMQIKELERLKEENGLNSLISEVAKEKLEIDASLNDIM